MIKYLLAALLIPIAALATQATIPVPFTPAVIYSGDSVKALRSNVDINGMASLRTGADNPTSTAVNAPQGSLYLRTGSGGGQLYIKQDAGSSTNWLQLAGGGSVASVALSLPGIFTVTGSPITTSGTLTGTLNDQIANSIWAGPASGPNAPPTFRALVAADIPSLPYISSLSAIGSTPNANGGTVTGSVLNLEPASASFGGAVTTGAQTMAGDKTFTGVFSASSTVKLGPGVVDLYGGGVANESPVTMFGVPPTNDPNRGMFTIADTRPLAVGVGGSIAFAGTYFTGSPPTFFATIQGANENGGSNNVDGYLAFNTRSNGFGIAEQMRISSLGAVGIGTTAPGTIGDGSSPKILQIHGTTSGLGGLLELTPSSTSATDSPGAITFGTTGASGNKRSAEILSTLQANSSTDATGDLAFFTSNAGLIGQRLTIMPDGKIGILTTTPDMDFQVAGSTGFFMRVGTTAGAHFDWSPNQVASFTGGSGSAFYINNDSTGDVRIAQGGGFAILGTAALKFPNSDGTSGQVIQTDGSGNLSFVTAGGSGANTALSNLASVAINTDLGFAGSFNSTREMRFDGYGAGGSITLTSTPAGPGTHTAAVNLTTGAANAADSGAINIVTGSAAGGAGTPASGNITIASGSATIRGEIKLQNGSEGTAGYVWTSTGTTGQGSWLAPSAPTGTANRVTIYDGSGNLTSDTEFKYTASTNSLSLGTGVTSTSTGGMAYGDAISGGSITSSSLGASAHGHVDGAFSISASNKGAHAFGFADGGNIAATGEGATAQGRAVTGSITASGNGAYAGGFSINGVTSSGGASFNYGFDTNVSGDFAAVFGVGSTAQAYGSFTAGRFADNTGTTSSWVSTDPLFVVGYGASSGSPDNAFWIRKDGKLYIKGPSLSGSSTGYVWTLQNTTTGEGAWAAASGGVTTMAAFGSSPNANGATISGANLTLQPASGSFPGGVTTGTQTMAGAKTFSTSALSPIFSTTSSLPASAGNFRLSNLEAIGWRNNANSGDVFIQIDGNNNLKLSGNNRFAFTDTGSGQVRMGAPSSVTTYVFLLPPDAGAADKFMRTDGSGTTTWEYPSILKAQTKTTGTAPAVSACGTSPSVAGTDGTGRITVGTGGVASSCTLTFNATWATAPACFVGDESTSLLLTGSASTTVLTITSPTPFGASDKIVYHCFGY